MKTTDTMTPEGKRLMEEIDKLVSLDVRVGFQAGKVFYPADGEDETPSDGANEDDDSRKPIDVAGIAVLNELGNDRIPSRPFLRMTADTKEDEIIAFAQREARLLKNGKATAESVLKGIGTRMRDLVKVTIIDGSYVPNAPSTILRKGSDKPLQDTTHMRESVNFFIVKKGTPD